jgi:hypothetical protein
MAVFFRDKIYQEAENTIHLMHNFWGYIPRFKPTDSVQWFLNYIKISKRELLLPSVFIYYPF